ncbi:ROK family protein [Rubinisphaera margarita]|uniref:ROK family protein n=1 Tax=Rubinisphaera margarita TaxID=2909586 RepID=UPI001EE852A1|nr:ROK family protein [Rubinisphaera margarita]MCG6156543.1 ROK family protein [Rubinisphaera margarita]
MSQLLAGVDLGGTTAKLAVADLEGEIVSECAIATEAHHGPENVLARIGDQLEELASKSSASISTIGFGAPGLVDIETGRTRFLPNLTGNWRDVDVAGTLGKRFSCPVRVLNDARAATLAELRFGHGASTPGLKMAFFSIGTGIGGGVAVNGELLLGPLGSAGELGHQTILPDGPLCGCGNHGCLETLASGTAIAAEGIRLMQMGLAPHLYEAVDGDANRVTPREMNLAAVHDSALRDALERAVTWIGIAAANVVTMLHPDLIVFGGGVAALGDLLLDTVRDQITTRVGMFPTDNVRVELSQLGDRAGVLGAIALAADAYQTPSSSSSGMHS